MKEKIIILRDLGIEHWLTTFNKMNNFIMSRDLYTFDEIWFVEHYPIFTQGQSEEKKNIIISNDIPTVKTNRGGQITYHGPGQQILYFLIDLKRRKMTVRKLIDIMQKIVINTLNNFSLKAYTKRKLPGVYIDEKKICSLGLRIKKGSTLHGLALNVDMDLTPFNYIHPCGDKNTKMTQIKNFNLNINLKDTKKMIIKELSTFLEVIMIKNDLNKD